jgi:hypothetical protein
MSTVLASSGRIRTAGDQTLVRGPYKHSNEFCGVKVYRTTNIDASAGVLITWENKVWDTGGFISSLPSNAIYIPRNGWYSCIAYINTTVYTYHVGQISLLVNGNYWATERLQMNNNTGLMNANSVYMADMYLSTGNYVQVFWDTNGTTGITLHNGGENGCALTIWRTG